MRRSTGVISLLAFAALCALCALSMLAVSCRRKPKPSGGSSAPSSSTSGAASDAALRFERFIAARVREDGGLDVAGVTRDNKIVHAELDASLGVKTKHELAADFTATEETSITLAASGVVVVIGRIASRSGVWLLHDGASPRAIDAEWCVSAGGVGWVVRDKNIAKVQFLRAGANAIDATSGPVTVPADTEAHLRCGPDSLAIAVGDGETLALSRLRPGSLSFTSPTSFDLEKPDDFTDELRERFVIPRAGDDVVVVRVGENKVSLRELVTGEATPRPWTTSAEFHLDEDADVVEVAAAPAAGSTVWILASEPQKGAPCSGGEAARRIVLHALKPGVRGTSRPVVELACGVEAIRAHLEADAIGAHLWWTEPVSDGSCSHPGLSVSAVVEAASERPGARHAALLAEGVARLADGRYLAVVRAGGCAPYDAPGNGTLAWGPSPK